MTRAVAHGAVEIAGWIGVGAFQLGNVIELHNGFVGVDEACSGVKTLQAAIMVSLVVGELLQLRAARRVMLLVAGCGWVFACNILRATTLVIIAARRGTEALHQWHDFIGTAVVIAGMAGLLAIAWLLHERESGSGLSVAIPATSAIPVRAWSNRSTEAPSTFIALAWLIAICAATELWFRAHERELIARPVWSARWPIGDGTREAVPIAETTRAILRYDDATSAVWEEPRGTIWGAFSRAGNLADRARQLVRSHSPEICLPAAGRTFRAELAPVTVDTSLLPLLFRAFEFEENGRPLFVFVCIQEDKVAPADLESQRAGFNARGRLLAAWHGERNLGQRLLELALIGVDDVQTAQEELERTVRATVQPTG